MKSEGKCVFCEKKYTQAGIGRHLMTHLNKKEKEYTGKKKGESFLVKAKAEEMFLMLWVDGETTYAEIDDFFRDIWLECCGHMSSFTDKKWNKINMDTSIENYFSKGMTLQYVYDFGSTTQLDVILVNQIDIPATESIVLLSRNEPLEIICDKCEKKPATKICSIDYTFVCPDCIHIHEEECEDFAEYASMPVVNSPRMGVCGYESGSIDTERDGVFKTS